MKTILRRTKTALLLGALALLASSATVEKAEAGAGTQLCWASGTSCIATINGQTVEKEGCCPAY